MNLMLLGINHKTAPLKVRERFSFTSKRLKEVLTELRGRDSILGAVILSTCNRTEIYAHVADGSRQITKFFLDNYKFTEDEMNRYFYVLEDADAVGHVFRVAGGLDSQVLGETQILGQVKSAWTIASETGAVSSLLDELFRKAVDVGKTVRTETKISRGNVSLGSAAIKMIEKKFSDLQDKLILIIGAGKIGTLISKYLKEKGISGIFVSNRTYTKAMELAENCEGKAINFSRLKEELKVVDIVISSTSSPHLILRKETLTEVMKMREKPLLVIDLALPRDVDPDAKGIQGISLYDLDDLKSVVEENYNKRKESAKLADRIVRRELDKFVMQAIRIGTRNSPLALKQVEEVIALLEKSHPECKFDVVRIETLGDRDKVSPLEKLEGTDFFTREIERALLERKIDLAVHSAKDMPDELPDGLEIAARLKSVDPYDVLVSKSGLTLEKLPQGAKIGTSSKRRKEGLKKFRPDFQIVDIRGNIEERLKLLVHLDAIVIAAAGLIRLGLEDRITERLPFHILEPHPLQGCLAIEIRTGDKKIKNLVAMIDSQNL